MTTTQSEDLNERVNHPRHYNQHPSGIECIELVEHLPANLANAVKYIWRCGLKSSETPLRDLMSARWYTKREEDRVELYEIDNVPLPTDIVWRAIARKLIVIEGDSTLGRYLDSLLNASFDEMIETLDDAIQTLEEKVVMSPLETELLAFAKQKLGPKVGMRVTATGWAVESLANPGVHGRRVAGNTADDLKALLERLPDFNAQKEEAAQCGKERPE